MIKDSYLSLVTKGLGEFKDRGSKFIGYAFPCDEIEQFEEHLLSIKKEHNKARHWCFAYRMGIEGDIYRANDDGEPSGSAGLPILGQLKSVNVVNAGIIVVRYFGGTKLGVPGLINAYKTAAQLAIQNASIVEKIASVKYLLEFDYGQMGHLMNTLKSLDINIVEKDFGDQASVTIDVRKSEEERLLIALKAKFLGISIEEFLSKDVDCGFQLKKIKE